MIPEFTGNNIGKFHTSKTYCKYSLTNLDKPVVITFSMLGKYADSKSITEHQDVWGYDYFVKRGFNCVSFCSIDRPYWYRDNDLFGILRRCASNLSIFKERLGYGGSMGGFGVLSLGNLLNIDRVLLFNPITTLSNELACFETRFVNAQTGLDWTSEFSDGALYNGKGTVIYDPLFNLDRLHVKRLNLDELKLPGVGHFIPVHLKKLSMLDWIVNAFLNNDIDPLEFYKKARSRRYYNRYYEWLTSDQNIYLTPKRKSVINKYWREYLYASAGAKIIKGDEITKLRDIAIDIESYDISASRAIMNILHELRPEGVMIANKLKEYNIHVK